MFSQFTNIWIVLALLIVDSDLEVRVKRTDIDLQTCIAKFNVHKDKIIRTQDSQNMGAKYLNEIDLGSREECLHLCCETDYCDVFVFEEKNSGSCYLFQCGPPDDFKCKFTHHVNYSSAILSINRHMPDLESQIKLTKHEQDLTKLRKPDLESETLHVVPEIRTTPSTTTTSTLAPMREIIPVNTNKKIPEEDQKCTRFQFECRSIKECIAIYNACDGIPQCSDGSDEAPELGCPGTIGTTATTFPIHPVPAQSLLQARYENNVQQPSGSQTNNNQQGIYLPQPQIIHETPQMLSPIIQRPENDFVRPGNVNINPRLPYDAPGLQPYVPQLLPQGQTNWMPHQSNQLPPQITQYVDKSSRIFNHKESGFQVPDGQEISQVVPSYTKIGNYYPENSYRQPIQQENWPSDDSIYAEQANLQKNGGQKIDYKTNIGREQPINIKHDDTVNPKHIQEMLAHDLKHSKDNMDHGNVHPSKVVINKRPHHKEEQLPDVVAYKFSGANDLEDGVSQTPRGAVLSLSLGLMITLVMAVLIGCRLRVVRRRMRRTGHGYVHDADFLVNGMYL